MVLEDPSVAGARVFKKTAEKFLHSLSRSQLPAAEHALLRQRFGEQVEVILLRNLERAELLQVRSRPLRVQQREAPGPQPLHKRHKRHLRGIRGPVKHALPEKRPADMDAVKPAS